MNQTSTDAQNEAPATVRTRRNFLRDLTLGSVAAAAAVTVVVPKAEAADPVPTTDHTGQVKVFRFSTRNNVSCRACRLHHRYMVFRSRKVARKTTYTRDGGKIHMSVQNYQNGATSGNAQDTVLTAETDGTYTVTPGTTTVTVTGTV